MRPESVSYSNILDSLSDSKNLLVNFVYSMKTCSILILTSHWLHSRTDVRSSKKEYIILQYLILNLASKVSPLLVALYDGVYLPTSHFIACSLLSYWVVFHTFYQCFLIDSRILFSSIFGYLFSIFSKVFYIWFVWIEGMWFSFFLYNEHLIPNGFGLCYFSGV